MKHEKVLEKMEEVRKEITSCPEKAREFLVDAGICDEDGKLEKSYRKEK